MCRASQREQSWTIASSARSGLMDIGRQQDVLPHRLGFQSRQRARARKVSEERGARAGERRCAEDEELVDEIRLEERGRERRAALEQERLDALRGEPCELV